MRYESPVFIFFGCLFEIFVDCIKLVKRNLFFKLVQIEYSHFYNSLSTFVRSISNFAVPLFVYSIQLRHFE